MEIFSNSDVGRYQLTSNQKEIVESINNFTYEELASFSIYDLSINIGHSPSAINKLLNKISGGGYKAFQIRLALVRNSNNNLDCENKNIYVSSEALDRFILNVLKIKDERGVINFISHGSINRSMHFFAESLRRIGINSTAYDAADEAMIGLRRSNTINIYVSMSGTNKHIVKILEKVGSSLSINVVITLNKYVTFQNAKFVFRLESPGTTYSQLSNIVELYRFFDIFFYKLSKRK